MKQLFTTKYVSFMAIGLMAAMSLGSCSNDNEPNVPPTGTTLAKITMGVTGLPQTKQSADDVNQDGTPKDIPSIVLVPMVNAGGTDTWQEAINLGALNASLNTTQSYANVAINRGVNKFRVYGGETGTVAAPITTDKTFELIKSSTQEGTTIVYDPAGLYYYGETMVADVATNSNDNLIIKADQTEEAAVSESTTDISITGVRYAVGLLTTRVAAATTIKYVDETGSTTGTETTFNGNLTLTGLFVGSQPEMVDAQFEPMEADGKTRIVRDGDIANDEITKNDNASSVAVNNYTTLFQTKAGEQATVVLRLTSDTPIYAINSEGKYEKVDANEEFYVRAVLAPANAEDGASNGQTCLFQKYYETKANLKINSLANATTDLPDITPTDVNLDVTVNLSWKAGFTFNETID